MGARRRRQRDDPGFATESLHALEAHLDWLERERDVDGDGLISILLPDESGLDDSPKYDPVYGPYAHYKPGYFRLVARYGARWAGARTTSRPPTTSTSRTCGSTSPTRSACARWRAWPATARTRARADRVEAALLERCLDPATGLFYDLAGRAEHPVRVSTWSALSPLMLDTLPEDVRRRLVEEHLLDPRRYRARVRHPLGGDGRAVVQAGLRPVAHVARAGVDERRLAAVAGLRELGYEEDADRIAQAWPTPSRRDGLREYYDPRTGAGWRRGASPGRRSSPTLRRRDGRRSRGCSSR